MKRKIYLKPTTMVVSLEGQCQILAGSTPAKRDGYESTEWSSGKGLFDLDDESVDDYFMF